MVAFPFGEVQLVLFIHHVLKASAKLLFQLPSLIVFNG